MQYQFRWEIEIAEDIKSGNLARREIFYEGMQVALREATIVQFIKICCCLEEWLHPTATEIPVLNQYFENVSVKDARFTDHVNSVIVLEA
jgi:hypothetical protein